MKDFIALSLYFTALSHYFFIYRSAHFHQFVKVIKYNSAVIIYPNKSALMKFESIAMIKQSMHVNSSFTNKKLSMNLKFNSLYLNRK